MSLIDRTIQASGKGQEDDIMKQTTTGERAPAAIVDYSEARERAIKWLGDRYLLAKPINADWRKSAAKLESRTR